MQSSPVSSVGRESRSMATESTTMKTKSIGSIIAARRRELGLTQEELADRVQVTRQSISNIERGKQIPSYTILIRITSILGISLIDSRSMEQNSDSRITSLESRILSLPEDSQHQFFEVADIILKGLANTHIGKRHSNGIGQE